MKFSEYRSMDATTMLEGIRDKQFTAEELLEAAQTRDGSGQSPTERRDPGPDGRGIGPDRGRPARRRIERIPFVVKNMDGIPAGEPCSMGSRALAGWVPEYDSSLFARYRDAGVVFLGKTNCPEFGIMGITEPELYGPSRNPWNTDHTPGGSSGGTAAAVAAGIVPVGHAGDGGGSIRIPAAYCGLFGLKPSRGGCRRPRRERGVERVGPPHVISRSVRDSALFLQATHGPDLGALYGEPAGSTRFVAAVGKRPRKLRVGVTRRAFLADEQHREIVAAVDNAAGLLAELGHDVIELDLAIDVEAVAQAYLTINAASVACDIEQTAVKTGVAPKPENFERATWFLSQVGNALERPGPGGCAGHRGSLTRSVARQTRASTST